MIVLEVKNIGGLIGRQRFEFKEGVNEILAPNATGKTSIVRAIVSLLSPIPPAQLLNIDSDEGYVKLEIDGKEYVRAFRRVAGKVIETESRPLAQDEKLAYMILDPDLGLISRRVILEKNSDITDFIIKIFGLDEIRKELDELRKKVEELKKEKDKREREVEDLRKKREQRDILLKQRETLLNELKALEDIEAGKIKDIERRIAELERRIASLSTRIEDINSKIIPQIEMQIKTIRTELDRYDTIIRDFYIRHKDPEKDIDSIRARIDNIDRLMEQFEKELEEKYGRSINLVLRAYESKTHICPVCGRHIDEPERFWDERVKSLESLRKDYEERIENLKKERDRLWGELEKLQKEYNEIRQIKEVKLRELEDKFSKFVRNRNDYEDEVKRLEIEKEIVLKEIEELKARLSDEERSRANKRLDIERRIGVIEQSIKDLDETIRSMSEAGEELIKIEEELDETVKNIEAKEKEFHETLSRMSDEFVKISNEIIKEFGFEWLKGIRLTKITEEGKEKYIVRVIRVFPSGREYEQPLELLSSSERFVISLVTVLVGYRLKIVEKYGMNVPIVADESLLSLDPERFEKVINELKRHSKYAIITRLARPMEAPMITIVHR